MSFEPRKWMVGLIPLAVLWVIAVAVKTEPVESDLEARSAAGVGADVVQNLELRVRGRDVKIAGLAFSEEGRQQAIDTVATSYGVRRIRAADLTLPPVAKPYAWSAKLAGGKIALAGAEPNPKVKATTAGMANALGPTEDSATFARGASEVFPLAANYALRQLALLSQGEVSLSDDALTISGQAASGVNYDKATALLKTPPVGVTIAKADIAPPLAKPFVFTAVNTGSGVSLSGVVPSFKSRDTIAAQAAASFAGGKVDNGLTIASGGPQGDFDSAANHGVAVIAGLTDGKAALTDNSLVITGKTNKFGVKEALAAKPGPAGFVIDISGVEGAAASIDNIAEAAAAFAALGPKLDAKGCEDSLKSELEQEAVQFDTGSATISRESYLLLVKLAGVALRCDVQSIDVSGHTDSQGDEGSNQQLSEARAKAVVDLLAKAGFPAPRLTSAGFGSTRPVASNDSEDGRAKNRRIEFHVQ